MPTKASWSETWGRPAIVRRAIWSTRGPEWATELHRSVDRDEQNVVEDRPGIPARSNPFALPGDTSRTSTRRAADSPHQTPPCRGAILGVRHSLAKVDSGTNSGRLQRLRAMPYRSKTKLRKAVTNHSPNRLSRPPSPASLLFDHVGLLVVFFRPAASPSIDHALRKTSATSEP